MADTVVKASAIVEDGVRPLKRLTKKQVENPLAPEILAGKFKEGDTVEVKLAKKDDAFEFAAAR
jgi:ATP-dependent Clp protease ATP-binding subunit ClpA